MTEHDIQVAIYNWRFAQGHHPIMPNFTPTRWWECDILSVTKSGFAHEYEIKISKSDFKADFKKESSIRNPDWSPKNTGDRSVPFHIKVKKHNLLSQRSLLSLNHFWYVTSEGLLDESDIPEYAGHAEAYEHGSMIKIKVLKQAPKLHKERLSDSVINQINVSCRYRYFDMYFKTIPRLRKQIESSNNPV